MKNKNSFEMGCAYSQGNPCHLFRISFDKGSRSKNFLPMFDIAIYDSWIGYSKRKFRNKLRKIWWVIRGKEEMMTDMVWEISEAKRLAEFMLKKINE